MVPVAPLPVDARARRLRRAKRISAPLRATLLTLVAAACASFRAVPSSWPLLVGLGLFFANVTLERATLPPRVEGWRDDRRTKALLALAFMGATFVAFADRGRGPVVALPAALQPWLLGGGASLVVVGAALRQWAIAGLGGQFTDRARIVEGHHLVQTGLYRHVRHPGYVGLVVGFAGFPLLLGSVLGLGVLLLLGPLAVRRRVQVEEALLAGHFGNEWLQYAARTPRYLPHLRG